jgi:hypothetical protein
VYKSVCSLCAVLPALHAKHAINGHMLRRMLLKLRFPADSTPTRFRPLLLFFLGEPTQLSSPPLPFRRSIPIALDVPSTLMSGSTRADKAMFGRVSLLVGSSRATANCGSQSWTSSWTIPRCRSVPRLGGCLSRMGEWGPQESLHYENTVLPTRVSGISEVNRPSQSRFVQRTGATFAEVCPKQRRH